MRALFFYVLELLVCLPQAQAQDKNPAPTISSESIQSIRLDELAEILQKKEVQRNELNQRISQSKADASAEDQKSLADLNRDIAKLNSTFELVALGNTDTSLLNETKDVQTDWQQDLLDILKPLIDSMKSLTERPRKIAELRDSISENEAKITVTLQAVDSIDVLFSEALAPEAAERLVRLQSKWKDTQEQLDQELLVTKSQLDRLTHDQQSVFQSVWPTTRTFLLGRGLTLLFVVVVAIAVWALMRLFWNLFTKRFTTKSQRRNSTWYRLAAYSYYLLTTFVIVFAALIVLYVREDLLLLALAFLLIAGVVLSFRQFLPRYIKEARLLLNLGPVREDERVLYNGLPWQVMSINLTSVLRNPALDGVIRLPLDLISTLVSRPVKNNLWFPSNRGDYIILPDGLLGQVRHQTPDLVEISIRGGMSMTYTTSDFYSINLTNLSREETFGVSITFGFDYSLQSISLTDIPHKLDEAIRLAFKDAGYEETLVHLIVELSTANASSLDYLVFATMKSQVAKDYYKLERLIQQTCVAVANSENWTIPFPQLTVHSSTNVREIE